MPRNAPGLSDVFAYSAGRAAGLTPDELRHPGWARPFYGVRAFQPPQSVLELAEAYRPRLKPEHWFSHTTAAVAHGMWLPAALQQRMEVHVAAPVGGRQPRGAGVRGHLLVERPGAVVQRQGLPVSREEEAWCQLAQVLGLEDLIAAGESLLAKNRTSRLELQRLIDAVAAGGRPRQPLLNQALPELRTNVRSAKETELRRLIVASGLPEPLINVDIHDERGCRVAESDLVYPKWRIAMEYEGELHFLDPEIQRKDVFRYELLQALGWRVIRVTKDDLRERRDALVARIRAAIASRS